MTARIPCGQVLERHERCISATPLRRCTIGDPYQMTRMPGHECHECPRDTAPSGHYSVEAPSMFAGFRTTSATSVARACGASTTPLGHYSVEALLRWGAELGRGTFGSGPHFGDGAWLKPGDVLSWRHVRGGVRLGRNIARVCLRTFCLRSWHHAVLSRSLRLRRWPFGLSGRCLCMSAWDSEG